MARGSRRGWKVKRTESPISPPLFLYTQGQGVLSNIESLFEKKNKNKKENKNVIEGIKQSVVVALPSCWRGRHRVEGGSRFPTTRVSAVADADDDN